MPTGYTCDLADKPITLRDFILRCSRAMGACISMREEPLDKPPPERFETSQYHADRATAARAELASVMRMDDAARERAAGRAFDEAETQRVTAIAKREQTSDAYEAMLASVKKWVPPTDDHVGLRDFMIDQLRSSIEYDCNPRYHRTEPCVRQTGAQWAAACIASLEAEIKRCDEAQAQEDERVAGRNAWLTALRASLPTK